MTRPFEGIRVIDVTHVLAGPFATYQLAVLGADVIKVEHPDEPDQSRGSGTDKALNRRQMGTAFLTQASNKRSIALDLKQEADREINAILADAKAKARFAELGATLLPGSVTDFGKLLADETEKWGKVVKFSGAKAE